MLLSSVRSLLFVPGDRPERMEKALRLGADALILDLEDSVSPAAKPAARAAVGARLSASRGQGILLIVRINPVESPFLADDLAAILPAGPDAIMLPKAEGATSLATLATLAKSLPPILPLAAETAAGVLDISSLRAHASHLCGLTWGAEDLAAELGASNNRTEGNFTDPFQLTRSLVLFTAHAADVPAIETVHTDIHDVRGLTRQAMHAARDGFSGMLAIHPAQIPIINRAFTPSAQEIAAAQAIVDAFAATSNVGVLKVGGKMVDAAHLKRARAILARHKP